MLGRRVGALAGEMKRLDKKSDLSLIRYNKEPSLLGVLYFWKGHFHRGDRTVPSPHEGCLRDD